MKQNNFLTICIFILLIGCNKNQETESKSFLNKIDTKSWNQSTYDFIKNNCSQSINDLYKNEKYLTKEKDTIKTFDEHIGYYLKNRDIFINELKTNSSLLTKYTDTLAISESYFGLNNPVITYTIANNKMRQSIMFNLTSDKLSKPKKIHSDHIKYDYDSILHNNPKCFVEFKQILNSVDFETIFYYDKNGELINEIKWGYFGTESE